MANNWNLILSNTNNLRDVLVVLQKVLSLLDNKVDLTVVNEALENIDGMSAELQQTINDLLNNDFMEPFATEAELLASTPILEKKAAKALDTKKVWLWDGVEWIDTGSSEYDLAKGYTEESIFEKVDLIENYEYVAAFADDNNNAALGIRPDGVVHTPKLETDDLNNTLVEKIQHDKYVEAKTDQGGNIVIGYRNDGSVDIPKLNIKIPKLTRTLKIGSDDSIMHIGDSMTASHYVVQDKSYVSQLSQLSPYRHINYGVSGNDLLNMQSRVLNDVETFGASLRNMKPRFAFIASFANDWDFLSTNLAYYQENTRRLIDICLSHGVQPVLISYFNVSSTQHQSIKSIANEYQIPLIWNDVLNRQVGFYSKATLFHEGHTGTRNGGLWWIPMLEYIDQQKPMRTIKIYRKRTGFTVNSDDDLLFKGRIDKSRKWKEIGVGHYSFANESKYDELDTLSADDRKWVLREDEYVKIANSQAVSFSDYALIEISLDALQQHIDNIEIELKVTGNISSFVRNNLDQTTEIPRVKPDDPKYQENWNKPRGKWRSVQLVDGKITINKDNIIYSMVGNKIYLMIKGSFELSDLKITYLADKYESSSPTINKSIQNLGPELLQQPLLGIAEQLSGWLTSGVITPIVPIDVSNAPRKPDNNASVDGVITLTPDNQIEQSVTLDSSENLRTFKVVAWVRYFPKAFLDMGNVKYSALDATQIEDRSKSGSLAHITKDSLDLRELKLETWTETQRPVAGGALQKNFVALQWRPVEFFIEVQPYETKLSIRLSASDGEIQIAKCSVKEVI